MEGHLRLAFSVPHLLSKLDPWLYRYPFEGSSARRYAGVERCGFGDLDERLCSRWDPLLSIAERFIDVGCGPAHLARVVARRYRNLEVIGVEPSRDFTDRPVPGVSLIRARAEQLPLADGAASLAACISSIRHVADRPAALSELRRVVRPGGRCFIVELDPAAPRVRWRQHTRRMRSRVSKLAFVPLVMRTAPTVETMVELARAAGWKVCEKSIDPVQPVYLLELG